MGPACAHYNQLRDCVEVGAGVDVGEGGGDGGGVGTVEGGVVGKWEGGAEEGMDAACHNSWVCGPR